MIKGIFMMNILNEKQKKELCKALAPIWKQLNSPIRYPQNAEEKNKKFSLSGKEIIEQKPNYIGCLGIAKGALYLINTNTNIEAFALITSEKECYHNRKNGLDCTFNGHVILAIKGNDNYYYALDPQSKSLDFYSKQSLHEGSYLYHPLFDKDKKLPYLITHILSARELEKINSYDMLIEASTKDIHSPSPLLLKRAFKNRSNNSR